ncbi:MAG TPA: hypothetical protein VIY52_13245 [Streptosporangiaceae bacterium]
MDPETRVLLQIGIDPTVWVLAASQDEVANATDPAAWQIVYPVEGRLVLSPRSAGSLVVLSAPPGGGTGVGRPHGGHPTDIHLPSVTARTVSSHGYWLEERDLATDVEELERKILTAMADGTRLTLPLISGTGGVLVLDGATLPFIVIVRAVP